MVEAIEAASIGLTGNDMDETNHKLLVAMFMLKHEHRCHGMQACMGAMGPKP